VKDSFGLIDNWLTAVHEVKSSNEDFIQETLSHITDEDELAKKTLDMMCELNALHQAFNLSKTTVVKAAWAKGMEFTIHAAIYGVADGKLYELGTGVNSPEELVASYDVAIAGIIGRYGK
jgi:carbonic anhydrase